MFAASVRGGLAVGIMLLLTACAGGTKPGGLDVNDWRQYKQRFVAEDGRVVDDGQRGISHSEGQAYGMLFAVAYDDREAFDRIWSWTRTHLSRPDGLFSWKWNPHLARVTDANNATDGDLGIGWALMRAAERWGAPGYRAQALRILKGLKGLEVEIGGFRVLMPGAKGFRRGNGAMLNPSYWMLPAFRDLARFDPAGAKTWNRMREDALRLARKARFGTWRLTPDWVDLRSNGEIRLARTRAPVFGYDALRVPLYLAWAGERELLAPYLRFWDEFAMHEFVPDRVDLTSDEIHLAPRPKAVRDIAALLRHAVGRKANLVSIDWRERPGYYDASLRLLVRLAWHELQGARK